MEGTERPEGARVRHAVGAATATVCVVLSSVELELLNYAYICEHQPLVVRALSAAKDGLRDSPSSVPSTVQHLLAAFDGAAASAIAALGTIAHAGDISSHMTFQALHAAVAVLCACNAVAVGAGGAATAAFPLTLSAALHMALHTRFEPVSRDDASVVGCAVVDLLSAVITHVSLPAMPLPLLHAALVALLRMCVDSAQPWPVRLRASAALLECAPRWTRAVVVEDSQDGGHHRALSSLQCCVLEMFNLLCDFLGTERHPACAVLPTQSSPPRPLLPPCALVHTYIPVPIEGAQEEHVRYGSSLGVEDGSAVPVDWAGWEARRVAAAATQDGTGANDGERGPPLHALLVALPRPSASREDVGSGGVSVPAGDDARLVESVPRVHAVSDSSALFALRVLSAMLGELVHAGGGQDGGGPRTRPPSLFMKGVVCIVKHRLTLPLCWMGDGVGPDDAALAAVHPAAWDTVGKSSGGLLSSILGGASVKERGGGGGGAGQRKKFRSLAGAGGAGSSGGSLTIPRLPYLRSAITVLLHLFRVDALRCGLQPELQQLVLRIILRGLTAPARLVAAAAAQVSPPMALRVVMEQLCEQQRYRSFSSVERSSRGDESSGAVGPADLLPLTVAELNAATKSVVGELGIAAKRSIKEGGGDLSSAIDPEAIRALVQLLHPRSPLVTTTSTCLDALHSTLTARQAYVVEAFLHGDGLLGGHDTVRSLCQMLASLSLGEASVHTLHGTLTTTHPSSSGHGEAAGGGAARGGASHATGPLPLPLSASLRHKAAESAWALLCSFRGRLASPPGAHSAAVAAATEAHHSTLRRKRLLQSCARTFNVKPSRGVEALRATGLLDFVSAELHQGGGGGGGAPTSVPVPGSGNTSQQHHSAVAYLLKWYGGAAGFDPVAVGQYLGGGEGGEEDGKRRAHASAHVQDFAGKPLVSALRAYLASYRLPGEAQQIDRILQAFSGLAHTVCSEAGVLPSIDATYLLAFSVIMLNTDLHNPAIRADRRMSEDAFVKNNSYYGDDICHGRRLPESLLRSIYREIRDDPIAPPPATFALLPVLAPAMEAGPAAPGNITTAQALACSGDTVSVAGWALDCRVAEEGAGPPAVDSDTHDVLLCAAWRAALPEAWHAAVRVGLAGFTAAFRSLSSGDARSFGTSRGGADSVKFAARVHLRTLATCAVLAAEAGMTSGVDIIIAALCRIAAHSLKCPYEEAAAGGGLEITREAGESRRSGTLGVIASVFFGRSEAEAGAGRVDRGRGSGGTWRPSSGSDAVLSLDGTHATPQPAVPTRNPRLARQPSFLAMSPTPASEGSDESVPPDDSAYYTAVNTAAQRVAGEFVCDLRAQMALSAALAIAMPDAQGGVIGETGWRWLCILILRLQRCGLWSWAGGEAGGEKLSAGDAEGEGAAALAPPLPPSAVQRLCSAYSLASAQALYAQRLHKAAQRTGAYEACSMSGRLPWASSAAGASVAADSGAAASEPSPGVFGGILGWLFGGEADESVEEDVGAAAAHAPPLLPPHAAVDAPVEQDGQDGAGVDAPAVAVEDVSVGAREDGGDTAGAHAMPRASTSRMSPVRGPDSALTTATPLLPPPPTTTSDFLELSLLLREEPEGDEDAEDEVRHSVEEEEGGQGDEDALTTLTSTQSGGRSAGRVRRGLFNEAQHTASVEALGANVNILLSTVAALPPSAALRAMRAFGWAASLPDSAADGAAEEEGGGGGGCSDDQSNNDGSAYISEMETCRFKCALLPAPAELSPTTRSARVAALLHAVVAAQAAPSRRLAVLTRDVVFACAAPTAHLRAVTAGFLDACTRTLSCAGGTHGEGAAAEQVLDDVSALCSCPPPSAGLVRMQVAAWLAALAAHHPDAFTALSLAGAAPGQGASGPPPALVQLLSLLGQQGWSDPASDGSGGSVAGPLFPPSVGWEGGVGGGGRSGEEDDDHVHVLEVCAAATARLLISLATRLLILQVKWNVPTHALPLLAQYATHPPHTDTIVVDDLSLCALDGVARGVRAVSGGGGEGRDSDEDLDAMLTVLTRAAVDPVRPAVRLCALERAQASLCALLAGRVGGGGGVAHVVDAALRMAEGAQAAARTAVTVVTPLLSAASDEPQGVGGAPSAPCESTLLAAAELASRVWLAAVTARGERVEEEEEEGGWMGAAWPRVLALLEADGGVKARVTMGAGDGHEVAEVEEGGSSYSQ